VGWLYGFRGLLAKCDTRLHACFLGSRTVRHLRESLGYCIGRSFNRLIKRRSMQFPLIFHALESAALPRRTPKSDMTGPFLVAGASGFTVPRKCR